ncbi:hypothetical protein OQA88_1063 [Cercophora sp. LCS_1]
MYEPNVFVVLKPRDGRNRAQSAFKLTHNARWFRPATRGVAKQATIGSRDITPADNSESEYEVEESVDRLVVTFLELLQLPNLSNGLQAGTDKAESHILLGHRGTRGISGQQYGIAVDDRLCIWLHDFTSTHGTAVGYNGQNEREIHGKDTWILAYEPGKRNQFGDITINCGGLVIAVEFPNHTVQKPDPKYIEYLAAFAAECKNEVFPPVEGLDLATQPSTQAPSETHTISDRLVYYKLIRARDGKFVAAKIFTPPASNKRSRGQADSRWLTDIRREYTLIKGNPHQEQLRCPTLSKQPNVIQVFELRETPEVMITMRYYRSGSIAQAGIVAEEKFVTAFGQILDCLTHLHSKRVVHRDIKPENILFEPAPYFKVVVSDFGLSKAIGGIPEPPSAPVARRGNDRAPDQLWRAWSERWMTTLRDHLYNEESGQLVDILDKMLIQKESRWPASQCLREGFENGLFKRRNADGLVICTNEEEVIRSPQAASEMDGATEDSQPSASSV